jgi:hypothetical protein
MRSCPQTAFSLKIAKSVFNLSLEIETNSVLFLSKVLDNLSFLLSEDTFLHLLQFISLFYALIDRNEITKNLLILWESFFQNIYNVNERNLFISQQILRTIFGNLSYQKNVFSRNISKILFYFISKTIPVLGLEKVIEFLFETFKIHLYQKLQLNHIQIFVQSLVYSKNDRQINLNLKDLIGFLIYNESENIFMDIELRTKSNQKTDQPNTIVID